MLQRTYCRGDAFTIRAEGTQDASMYAQSATLNGAPFGTADISHAAVPGGGTLAFGMGAAPLGWGERNRI